MNIVEEYLSRVPEKKLSIGVLHRELQIKKRAIIFYVNQSSRIRQVKPCEVGSGKTTISVFTYD